METLYALAEMFSDNDNANKNNLENSPSEAKPPALPECRESPPTAFKGGFFLSASIDSCKIVNLS